MENFQLLFLLAGAVSLVLGMVFLVVTRTLGKLSVTTPGTIIEITSDPVKYNKQCISFKEIGNQTISLNTYTGNTKSFDVHEATMYHKVYRYTVNGQIYTRADGVGYNKGLVAGKIGEEVMVYYDPADPFRASLSSGKSYKILAILFLSLAFLFLLSGIIAVIL